MATWTEFLKHIDFGIKNADNYTTQDFTSLIDQVQKVLDEMPEVLANGMFSQNRKLKLLGKLNKLQILRLGKEETA